ncbi:lysophospholipid acyltransferase family protein [Atopobiaceae bacterium 24-176]
MIERSSLNHRETGRRRRRRRALYRLLLPVLAVHLRLFYGFRVRRAPGAPKSLADCVVVANHVCILDAPMVAAAAWPVQVRFLSLAQNGKNRLYGPIVRAMGTLFVGEDLAETREMLRRQEEALASGEAVGIFPEGRLDSYATTLGPTVKGAFRIAVLAGVPVVSVALVQRRAWCLNRLRGMPGWEAWVGPALEPPAKAGHGAQAADLEARSCAFIEGRLAASDWAPRS